MFFSVAFFDGGGDTFLLFCTFARVFSELDDNDTPMIGTGGNNCFGRDGVGEGLGTGSRDSCVGLDDGGAGGSNSLG